MTIPKKNYIILVILIVVTVFLTLFLSQMYKDKTRALSNFYLYSNKITVDGFEEYINEVQDAIIYISDKYDLSHEEFESKFKEKIDALNLKNNVVFIEQNDVDNNYKKILKKNIDRYPVIILIIDNKLSEVDYISEDSNAENIIDYSKFE